MRIKNYFTSLFRSSLVLEKKSAKAPKTVKKKTLIHKKFEWTRAELQARHKGSEPIFAELDCIDCLDAFTNLKRMQIQEIREKSKITGKIIN